MKQDREQKAFKDAIDEACRLWNTGSMSINQATKHAAKKHKVNADELARYVFEYTKNKMKVTK